MTPRTGDSRWQMGAHISSGNNVSKGRMKCMWPKHGTWEGDRDAWRLASHRHCFHTTALPPAKPALGFRLLLSSRSHSKVIGLGVWNKTYIPSWRWGSKREKWRGRLGCILKSPSCQLGTRIWVKCSSSGVRQSEFKTPFQVTLPFWASVYSLCVLE